MKPITKKVIEAGLVSKHTLLLMQRWGYLGIGPLIISGSEDTSRTSEEIRGSFNRFVEELEELLDGSEDADIKQTLFSTTLKNPSSIMWNDGTTGVLFKDEADRIIFTTPEPPLPGRKFKIKNGGWFEILSYIPLWTDDTIIAYQVEVNSIREPYAKLPKL